MYPDANDRLTYETKDSVYFFISAFDPLGNFSSHAVEVWGQIFPTVEHAFQWKKFDGSNQEWADKVLMARSAWLARKLGREGPKMRSDWHEARIEAMTEIIRAKFAQHEDAKKILLKTANKKIIENSPIDDYWGCGSDGKGENNMGKILMQVRDEIVRRHSK